MIGAFRGGQLVEQIGFPALGFLCAAAHIVSTGILGVLLVEARDEDETPAGQSTVVGER